MAADLTVPWPAPAKLNRFLHIVGRRDDGYHLLQTLFQFLDHGDRLRFVPRADDRIRLYGGVAGLDPEQDLTVRATRLLQRHCGVDQGVEIHLDKRLPAGGGLGGGSSDAATTLVALNHYWRAGLDLPGLADLGLTLGADVPVFVHGRAAWAEGVGEQLHFVEPDEPWFLILVPSCAVSTVAIFNAPDLTRDSRPTRIRAFIVDADRNDCEAAVFRSHPEVARAARWLSRHGRARLTGTGGCVFAAFPERAQAEALLARRPAGVSGFVARGCNRSPLHERLRRATIDEYPFVTGP